jgi:hypothetical protein
MWLAGSNSIGSERESRMALAGKGVLAIWNGIAPEAEADFVAWHVREHIPERVAVPGFLRGRRYVGEMGHPKYFNFYETEDIETLKAPAYLERLNAPSDWTRSVVRHFRDTIRTPCTVAFSEGRGDGGWMGTIRLTGSPPDGDRLVEMLGARLLAQSGVVAAHLLEGVDDRGGPTAEKALRSQADGHADWILMVEAVSREAIDRAYAGAASDAVLASLGLVAGSEDRGVYRLEYGLSRSQLG